MTITIVWDWDGTLADTYPVFNAAYAHTFEKLGIKEKVISFAEVKKITSTMQNKDVLSHVFGEEKKEKAGRCFYDYLTKNHVKELKTINGAREVLEYCQKKGITSHLLSNKPNKKFPKQNREPYLTQELAKLKMGNLFTNVVGSGEYNEDKPAPVACYAVFGGKDKLPKGKNDLIIVIGDGEADIKVAETYKEAGANAISVLYDPEKIYNGKAKPDRIISNLNAVPLVINNEKKYITKQNAPIISKEENER